MSNLFPAAAIRAARKNVVSLLEGFLFSMVLTLLTLVLLQVFTRYVMQLAIPWTEEVARIVLVWTVMLGATIAADRNEHYAITFLSGKLRGSARLTMLLVTNVLGIAFLITLVIYGTAYLVANIETVNVATQTSRAWVYAALPGCALLMTLSLVFQSIEAWIEGPDASVQVRAVAGDV